MKVLAGPVPDAAPTGGHQTQAEATASNPRESAPLVSTNPGRGARPEPTADEEIASVERNIAFMRENAPHAVDQIAQLGERLAELRAAVEQPIEADLVVQQDDNVPANVVPIASQQPLPDPAAIYARLVDKPPSRVRSELRKLRSYAGGDDGLLTEVLLKVEHGRRTQYVYHRIRKKLVQHRAWSAETDHWGLQSWCRTCPRLELVPERDAMYSGDIIAWRLGQPKGWLIFDRHAADVAHAAGWPTSWRGDWGLLVDWLGRGAVDLLPERVKEVSDRLRREGKPARTLYDLDNELFPPKQQHRKAAA
jgi:hypothetical protein